MKQADQTFHIYLGMVHSYTNNHQIAMLEIHLHIHGGINMVALHWQML